MKFLTLCNRFLFCFILMMVIVCSRHKNSHNLTLYLNKSEAVITKTFGQPLKSQPYGKTMRMEYNGQFENVQGTWGYYLLPDEDSIVSIDFTVSGDHRDVFSKKMIQNLGEPLTIEQLTLNISTTDRMGELAKKQIIQNYNNGMRVWENKSKNITYFLNVEGGETIGYDKNVTSVVSIRNYQAPAIEKDKGKSNTHSKKIP